jgi:protein-disulfide isomerase
MPDGKHAIADTKIDFGINPYAEKRKLLQDRANGPAQGAAGKELLLVEFSDLQCPHCKEAATTMDQLARDFPKARIVHQAFPLVAIHPAAFQAAAVGVCVAKQSSDAYFKYEAAVYATQEALTPEGTAKTLDAAVTKAGLDPAAIDLCAATAETKAAVTASAKLAEEAGVDQTPTLSVNGRLLPVSPAAMPYEILKKIIVFQAGLDGVKVDTPPPSLNTLK